jgi:hypothetical protein
MLLMDLLQHFMKIIPRQPFALAAATEHPKVMSPDVLTVIKCNIEKAFERQKRKIEG